MDSRFVNSIQINMKRALKERGLRQEDLARELGVSLPTVKRLLNGDDLSVLSIGRVCEVLGISTSALFKKIDADKPEQSQLTDEQERFFAKHPEVLAYFIHLLDDMSPDEIQRKYSISSRSTQKYLNLLDSLKLIRRGRGNSANVLIPRNLQWRKDGPLGLTLSRDRIRRFFDHAIEKWGKDVDSIFFPTGAFLAEEKTVSKLMARISQAIDDCMKEASMDRFFSPREKLKRFSFAFVCDAWDDPQFSTIPEIDHRIRFNRIDLQQKINPP